MQKDVYDTHQLHVIDDAQLMTESVIDDALLQAMMYQAYADSVLWRYEILSGILAVTFLYGLLWAHDIDIHLFIWDTLSVKVLSSWLKIILAKTVFCRSKQTEKYSHGSPQNTY